MQYLSKQPMKFHLLVAGLVAAITHSVAMAEGKGPRHGDPEVRLQRMQQHLQLDDYQVEQIRNIQTADIGWREKREQVNAVLDDDQRAMLDEHRARMRENFRQRRGTPPDAPAAPEAPAEPELEETEL
ncbi:MAG: hypothetical protein AAGI24_13040 [Pseudomonadota bacterium]